MKKIAAVLIALIVMACADYPTEEKLESPAIPIGALSLSVVYGDGQTGNPGEELPDPLVVLVESDSQPVENQIVNFRVISGNGEVFAGVALTNSQGLALDYWTLGDAGNQTVEARAVSADSTKQVFGTFTATLILPPPPPDEPTEPVVPPLLTVITDTVYTTPSTADTDSPFAPHPQVRFTEYDGTPIEAFHLWFVVVDSVNTDFCSGYPVSNGFTDSLGYGGPQQCWRAWNPGVYELLPFVITNEGDTLYADKNIVGVVN